MRVFVTVATGFIGSAIASRTARARPGPGRRPLLQRRDEWQDDRYPPSLLRTSRRGRGRPRRAAARAMVGLLACLLLAAAAGCDGDRPGPRPGPTGPTGSGVPSTLADQPGDRRLVDRLRQGGQVIFIRHAATEATEDDPRPDLADPSTQRNLSDAGREQARQLGRAISRLQIPVGTVLASPYARTRESAELAFGRDRVRVTHDLLNEAFPGTDDEELARRLRRLLATRPPAGQNTVLVSHGFNLQGATGLSVAEGESAVFAPGDAGRSGLIARITTEEWQRLAQL
jgi:broad specificity phosphatase PhoE